MSLLTWPFKRKTYDGILNPRFVSDIQAANEAVLDGIAAITGLNNTDFAIITGMNYVTGVPNTYTPGIFYLNGVFYIMSAAFSDLNYLVPAPQDTMSTIFSDAVLRNIYTVQYGNTSPAAVAGSSPEFVGNMNQYRIGLKYFQAAIAALQTVAANLGNSSNLNIGTTAGTVAAGNDSRLVYTLAQFNTLFAQKSPSAKGEIKKIYDIDGTFLSNFDGTGLGIVAPWINWARFNGNNGLPNAAGTMFVGDGSGFVSKVPGGNNSYQIHSTDLPVLATTNEFASAGGSTFGSYIKINASAASLGSVPVNPGSPNNPISLLSKYIPVYFIGRIA
jgi:hypothetical protein